jgi:hypothetical protein
MSEGRTAAGAAARMGSGAGRLIRAWRGLPRERRLAASAAGGLFLTMFLPWYQRQFFVVVSGRIQPGSDSQTAWAQFSFVEAAVLLVAVGVLTLLFQRAEGKAFHLPGGDGWVITVAGFWTCLLIVWRIFDKQGGSSHGQNATSYGIEWGIFVALVVAALLAYAGSRIRAAHQPEPPLPGEDGASGPRRPGLGEHRPDEPRPRESGNGSPAPARPARREVGWLTAPPEDRGPQHTSSRPRPSARSVGPPPEWSGDPALEWPERSRPASAPRPVRPPKPVAAEDPSTIAADDAATIPTEPRGREQHPQIRPSTAAARREQRSDEQMTIPLEPKDRG